MPQSDQDLTTPTALRAWVAAWHPDGPSVPPNASSQNALNTQRTRCPELKLPAWSPGWWQCHHLSVDRALMALHVHRPLIASWHKAHPQETPILDPEEDKVWSKHLQGYLQWWRTWLQQPPASPAQRLLHLAPHVDEVPWLLMYQHTTRAPAHTPRKGRFLLEHTVQLQPCEATLLKELSCPKTKRTWFTGSWWQKAWGGLKQSLRWFRGGMALASIVFCLAANGSLLGLLVLSVGVAAQLWPWLHQGASWALKHYRRWRQLPEPPTPEEQQRTTHLAHHLLTCMLWLENTWAQLPGLPETQATRQSWENTHAVLARLWAQVMERPEGLLWSPQHQKRAQVAWQACQKRWLQTVQRHEAETQHAQEAQCQAPPRVLIVRDPKSRSDTIQLQWPWEEALRLAHTPQQQAALKKHHAPSLKRVLDTPWSAHTVLTQGVVLQRDTQIAQALAPVLTPEENSLCQARTDLLGIMNTWQHKTWAEGVAWLREHPQRATLQTWWRKQGYSVVLRAQDAGDLTGLQGVVGSGASVMREHQSVRPRHTWALNGPTTAALSEGAAQRAPQTLQILTQVLFGAHEALWQPWCLPTAPSCVAEPEEVPWLVALDVSLASQHLPEHPWDALVCHMAQGQLTLEDTARLRSEDAHQELLLALGLGVDHTPVHLMLLKALLWRNAPYWGSLDLGLWLWLLPAIQAAEATPEIQALMAASRLEALEQGGKALASGTEEHTLALWSQAVAQHPGQAQQSPEDEQAQLRAALQVPVRQLALRLIRHRVHAVQQGAQQGARPTAVQQGAQPTAVQQGARPTSGDRVFLFHHSLAIEHPVPLCLGWQEPQWLLPAEAPKEPERLTSEATDPSDPEQNKQKEKKSKQKQNTTPQDRRQAPEEGDSGAVVACHAKLLPLATDAHQRACLVPTTWQQASSTLAPQETHLLEAVLLRTEGRHKFMDRMSQVPVDVLCQTPHKHPQTLKLLLKNRSWCQNLLDNVHWKPLILNPDWSIAALWAWASLHMVPAEQTEAYFEAASQEEQLRMVRDVLAQIRWQPDWRSWCPEHPEAFKNQRTQDGLRLFLMMIAPWPQSLILWARCLVHAPSCEMDPNQKTPRCRLWRVALFLLEGQKEDWSNRSKETQKAVEETLAPLKRRALTGLSPEKNKEGRTEAERVQDVLQFAKRKKSFLFW